MAGSVSPNGKKDYEEGVEAGPGSSKVAWLNTLSVKKLLT
jgi:hypothetical protein